MSANYFPAGAYDDEDAPYNEHEEFDQEDYESWLEDTKEDN